MTDFYSPDSISTFNARDVIDNAYLAAAQAAPNRVNAVSELLQQEPTAHDVITTYAHKSVEGNTDAHALLEEALAKVNRAQSVDAFRDVFNRVVDGISMARIDELRAQAVTDLDKHFRKTVKALTDAAKHLDPREPLNKDIVFQGDTSAHYRTAVQALQTLAAYTFSAPPHIDSIEPRHARVLAILDVPRVTKHAVIIRDHLLHARYVHDDQTPAREQIQKFFLAYRKDIDTTLVRVAQGAFPGVRFNLATPEELTLRALSVNNTYSTAPAVSENTP